MTIYSRFIDASRKWSARPDLSNDLMETFVRSAESFIDREMRVKESIVVSSDVFDADGRFLLPNEYNELVYIKPENGNPLHYSTYDNFFSADGTTGEYTTVGNTIICGSSYAAMDLEVAFYSKVPHFGTENADTPTWLFNYYYDIYLQAVNVALLFYSQEWERSTSLQEIVMSWIAKANGNSKIAQMSGSPLIRRPARRIG